MKNQINARAGRTTALALILALSGCASAPDLGPPPQPSSPQSLRSSRSLAGDPGDWPSSQWWKVYGDKQLDALIAEALEGSPTLATAAARVRQAEAAAQRAGAYKLPSAGAQSSLQESRQDLSADNLPDVIRDALPDDWSSRSSLALQMNYQLDFFGKHRALLAAATSTAAAAKAEEAAAQLQLSTAVASAYADLVRLADDRRALERALALRNDSLTLVTQRQQSGIENQAQTHQAAAQAEQARADLAQIDGLIARTRNVIAALLGAGPDRGLDISLPEGPTVASRGLPGDIGLALVGRRPDLVAARLAAEAEGEKVKAAKASYYPDVNLMAVVGVQTLGLDRLGGGTLSYAQAGPSASLPIFTGGELEGQYRGARAGYDAAVAAYNQTLTYALKEVADAIVDRRALDQQLSSTRAALAQSEQSYVLIRTRYQGGLTSYYDTLSVENALVAQRRAVADLEARAFSLDVALVRALGGGYRAT